MAEPKYSRITRALSVLLAAIILFFAALSSSADATSTTTYYENAVLYWTNVERSRAGVSKLSTSGKLESVAGTRARELASRYSHTRPSGKRWTTALTAKSISYRSAAENIAKSYDSPCEVVKAWMESDGHRDHILDSKYTHMGSGCYYSSSNGKYYWEQVFTSGVSFSDEEKSFYVAPKGVSADKTRISISVGKKTTLTGTPSPVYATSLVSCKSSDSSVIKVVDTEVNVFTLKAVSAGTAVLTVKCGSYSVKVPVTVHN